MLMRVSLVLSLLVLGANAQVDWRRSQSPVKDQGHRGTCAAFAICGALETFPGVPGDLSEQLLYATLKLHQNDCVTWLQKFGQRAKLGEGDLFDKYVALFEVLGTCAETFLPYDPDPKRAAASVPEDLKRYLELAHVPPAALERIRDGYGKYGFAAGDCTVLDAEAVRDETKLQQLLAAGNLAIPVGYAVHGPSWSKLAEVGNAGPDGKRVFVHPGMMARFSRDGTKWLTYNDALIECMQRGETFASLVRAGTLQAQRLGEEKDYGGHAVLLVGYDERGFLAKNSWGTGWGDGGYFRITYDYHRLYAGQALVLTKAQIRNPALSPFELTRRIREGNFRIKVQPRPDGTRNTWQLSTWMEEPRDAGFTWVEYTIEGKGQKDWQRLAVTQISAGDSTARTGAPWLVDERTMQSVAACNEVRVRVRIGANDTRNADGTMSIEWLREFATTTFAPKLEGAQDLAPRL
jgi:hypothetical protein